MAVIAEPGCDSETPGLCRSLLLLFLALTGSAIIVPAQAAAPPSGNQGSQTNAVPILQSGWRPVVTGRLNNGVRFAILPRQGNEPGLGLLVRNEGGFIAERRPGERGLTHLIEHLVFVSPTEKAPAELHHFLRIGGPLTFPAPTAGTTTWRETNYFVSTKTTRPADLNTLLNLFREVTSELTFRTDAVDAQRADVMREMAERKRGNDIFAEYIAAVAPGSPNDVIDAQNSDDVPTASVDTIRALYRRLYRPENMMIVVVGNVDAAQTKALIQKRFSGWKSVEPAPPRPSVPAFQSNRIRPISVSALPQGRRIVMMTVVTPTPPPPFSRVQQADAMLMDMVAVRAINTHLVRAQPDSPAGDVGIFIENGEQGHRLIMLWDNFAADQWRSAVAGLKQTTCDLDAIGLPDEEWETAKQNVVKDLEERARTMAKTSNVELAKDLSHAFAAGQSLLPPDELLRRAQAVFHTISAQRGNGWWRRQWRTDAEHLRVEAPELAQVKDPLSSIRTIADEAVHRPGCKIRP